MNVIPNEAFLILNNANVHIYPIFCIIMRKVCISTIDLITKHETAAFENRQSYRSAVIDQINIDHALVVLRECLIVRHLFYRYL